MSDLLKALMLGGAVVGGVYLIQSQQPPPAPQPPPLPKPKNRNKSKDILAGLAEDLLTTGLDRIVNNNKHSNSSKGGLGGFLSDLLGGRGKSTKLPDPITAALPGGNPVKSPGNLERQLLRVIGNAEAPQGYNQVYGGIRRSDYPSRPITQMTVAEVLAWQDSIDAKYMSEASGRYQIMEDTLRDYLVARGHVKMSDRFDAATQDRCAVVLMERRGLSRFKSGRIGVEEFGKRLAQEWASLPVLKRTRGKKRQVERGQSYYAGDGLNRAHVRPSQIEGILNGYHDKGMMV